MRSFIQDIAFWTPEGFVPNDFYEIGRGVAGRLGLLPR